MADDAHAAHPKQRSAAVLVVVQSPTEVVESLAAQHRPHLGGDGAGKRLAQQVAEETPDALAGLERHVAHKSVADNHVRMAVEDVAAFHVADEMDWQRFEQREALAGEVVAFALFLADGEQADTGLGDFKDGPRVHLAHHGELLKVVGFAVDIGADVEQDTRGL